MRKREKEEKRKRGKRGKEAVSDGARMDLEQGAYQESTRPALLSNETLLAKAKKTGVTTQHPLRHE